MIKIGEMNTKFCIRNEEDEEVKEINSFQKTIGNLNNHPLKLILPPKIEPIKPPDTIPQLSDSKPNTSRIKNNQTDSMEIKNLEINRMTLGDKNTTAVTISKKTVFESMMNNNNQDNSTEFFVEKRYCTKCSLEQPLRCKHCLFCGRCVGTYDHHCAWIG